MIPIRIDENSTNKVIESVFELKSGEIFCMPQEFEQQFKSYIPEDRFFRFVHAPKGSTQYKKWGANCYMVICNFIVVRL